MNLGEEFRKHRVRMGLTQREFALLLGTSQSAVSEWELGAIELRLSTAARYGALVGLAVTVVCRDVRHDPGALSPGEIRALIMKRLREKTRRRVEDDGLG